jgi:hypothetical protein
VRSTNALLWAGLAAFTLAWIAGLVLWWFFTYRVTMGPLVAGSAIAIDGKPVATLWQPTAEFSTLLSRGRHTLTVTAPAHVATEFSFMIGWTGIRRHFALSPMPDVACVTFAGAQYPSIAPGAVWPDHPAPNEHCAPVGTKAMAEWRPDPTQPPLRQDFQYAKDGDMVELNSGMATPSIAQPLSPAGATAPPPTPSLPPSVPANPLPTTTPSSSKGGTATVRQQAHVEDLAGVIDQTRRQELESYCSDLERSAGAQLTVVTVPSLSGQSIEDYAHAIAAKRAAGQNGKDTGVLLVLAIGDHRSRLQVGNDLKAIVPDIFAGETLRGIQPKLRAGLYGEALLQAAKAVGARIAQAKGAALQRPVP